MTQSTHTPYYRRLCRLLLVAGLLLVVAGPVLSHFELVRALTGFMVFVRGLGVTLLALVIAVVVAIVRREGMDRVVIVGGLPVFAFVLVVLVQARAYPRVNDITTDWSQPPAFVHATQLPANLGRDLAYPGETFAREQRRAYPEIQPLRLSLSPHAAFELALTTARTARPEWELTHVAPDRLRFEGTATTRVFRFRDDFVVEVRPVEDGTAEVHMRSKSRDGRGDLGVNARRIREFLQLLAEASSGRQ